MGFCPSILIWRRLLIVLLVVSQKYQTCKTSKLTFWRKKMLNYFIIKNCEPLRFFFNIVCCFLSRFLSLEQKTHTLCKNYKSREKRLTKSLNKNSVWKSKKSVHRSTKEMQHPIQYCHITVQVINFQQGTCTLFNRPGRPF